MGKVQRDTLTLLWETVCVSIQSVLVRVLFRIQLEMSTWHSDSERWDPVSPVEHTWASFHKAPSMMSP